MDSDGSPQRLVQSYMEFPVSIDCIALHTHKEVRNNEEKRKSPFGSSGSTVGCPPR